MNDVLKKYITDKAELQVAVNKISGLFNASFSLGAFLGPLVFTFVYHFWGWRLSTDVFTVMTGVYAVVLLVVSLKMN